MTCGAAGSVQSTLLHANSTSSGAVERTEPYLEAFIDGAFPPALTPS